MKKKSSRWKNLRKKMTKKWAIMTTYQIITFLLSVVLVYGVVNFAVTKSYKARQLYLSDSFTVTAHSGSNGTPDNSIESIENAIAVKADVVEFDVRFRPDGTPVMAHDPVLSNKRGVLIEDAFRAVTKKGVTIQLNLDIKETSNLEELQMLVETYKLEERAFLTGVGENDIETVQTKCPKLRYYLNYTPSRSRIVGEKYQQKLLKKVQDSGAIGINCNFFFSSETLSTLLHNHDLLLSVWTVNNEDEMARALVNRADNITSKEPDKVIELIENWHK